MGLKSSKALAIGSGTLRANLPGAMAIVPLQKSGYFGEKSPSHPKGGNVRIHESSNPLKDAYDFQARLAAGYTNRKRLEGKGWIYELPDKTRIVFRVFSSSPDKSPVVSVEVSGLDRVKRQKIHFVKKRGSKHVSR